MRQTIIRKSAAVFLLTVFVLCNAPVTVLHTLFADHKDEITLFGDNNPGDKITSAGFTCKLAPLVVTIPLVMASASPEVKNTQFSDIRFLCCAERVIKKEHFHSSLRAPPVLETA